MPSWGFDGLLGLRLRVKGVGGSGLRGLEFSGLSLSDPALKV